MQAKLVKTNYPAWALFIAGVLVLSTMLPVPFVFFVRYFRIWKFESDVPAVSAICADRVVHVLVLIACLLVML